MTQCNNIDEVRENIDRIDKEMVQLIAERGRYVKQAAAFKRNKHQVKAEKRMESVIEKAKASAQHFGADEHLVAEIYTTMITGFVKLEMNEFQGKQKLGRKEI